MSYLAPRPTHARWIANRPRRRAARLHHDDWEDPIDADWIEPDDDPPAGWEP